MEAQESVRVQPGAAEPRTTTASGDERERKDSSGREDEEDERLRGECSFPSQWPLFESPTVTTIRVTSYKDKQGTIVS